MPNFPKPFDPNYTLLLRKIGDRYAAGHAVAVHAVNHELVLTYWEIGRYIFEFEQEGADRAVYGNALMKQLAADLTVAFGKGFSLSNLKDIRRFYLDWPKSQTLSGFLNWSHYVTLYGSNPPPPAPSTNNKPSSKNGRSAS